MDLGVVLGLLLGVGAIAGSFVWEGGQLGVVFQGPAMLVVLGGTIATALVGSGVGKVAALPIFMKIATFTPKWSVEALIDQLVSFAEQARKEGILSLEPLIDKVENYFAQKGLKMMVDGISPETIKDLMTTEMAIMAERHKAGANLFSKMGGYSPTMGIIGTVLGLINTLANAGGDPTQLIRHIASAFIATLWGVFMANIVWLPISDKLKMRHSEEEHFMLVAVEGIVSIQAGDNPRLVRAKLTSMLSQTEQKHLADK